MCTCAHKGEWEEHGPRKPGVPAPVQLWHWILLEKTWFTQSLCSAYTHHFQRSYGNSFFCYFVSKGLHALSAAFFAEKALVDGNQLLPRKGREMSLILHKACLCTLQHSSGPCLFLSTDGKVGKSGMKSFGYRRWMEQEFHLIAAGAFT